jgi:hypothetical protein
MRRNEMLVSWIALSRHRLHQSDRLSTETVNPVT